MLRGSLAINSRVRFHFMTTKCSWTTPSVLRFQEKVLCKPIIHCTPSTSVGSVMSQPFSKVTDSRATELYMEDAFSDNDPLEDLRKYLYPDSTDPIVNDLSKANSVKEVLELWSANQEEATVEQSAQAFATLFHLQKVCRFVFSTHWEQNKSIAFEFVKSLQARKEFVVLKEKFRSQFCQLSPDQLSFLFLCMRRLDVPLHDPVMQDIYLHLNEQVPVMSSTALSYFSCGLRNSVFYQHENENNFSVSWSLALANALPRIRQLISEAENGEDLKKVAICFNSLAHLVSQDLMAFFAEKTCLLIDNGAYKNDEDIHLLCKVLSLVLTKKDWHMDKGHFIRKVLLQFRGRAHLLRPSQFLVLAKVVIEQTDPIVMFYEVDELASKMYDKLNEKGHEYQLGSLDLLRILLDTKSRHFKKHEIVDILNKTIQDDDHFQWYVNSVIDVFRSSGLNDAEMKNKFLNKTLDCVQMDPHELTRLAQRYFSFNNRQNGALRDAEFENRVVAIFEKSINEAHLMRNFSLQFGFLIAFSKVEITDETWRRFDAMVGNMDATSLGFVSKGVEIRQMTRNSAKSAETKAGLEKIGLQVYKRCLDILGHSTSVSTNISILRSLVNVKSLLALNELKSVAEHILGNIDSSQLTFGLTRQMCSLLNNLTNMVSLESFLDHVTQYTVSNRIHVHSSTLANIMMLNFHQNCEIPNKYFWDICKSCLMRDFQVLDGRTILQMSKFLIRANSFSIDLAQKVFSEKMMEKLDNEIEYCESNSKFPNTLRIAMMELNRAVCLANPEFSVPWFHEKFCQERSKYLLDRESASRNPLMKREVSERLSRAVGGSQFVREDVFSPYYNVIDLEIVFDIFGNPVTQSCPNHNFSVIPKSLKKDGHRRLAVKIMSENDYVAGGLRLKGISAMNIEQLETQGFDVLVINPYIWNAMNLGTNSEKEDLLKREIASFI